MNIDKLPLDKKIEISITSGRSFDPNLRNWAMLFYDDRYTYLEDNPSNHNSPLGLQIALGSMDVLDKKYDARKLAKAFDCMSYIRNDYGLSKKNILDIIKTPEEFSLALFDPMIYFPSKQCGDEISKDEIPSDSKFYSRFR